MHSRLDPPLIPKNGHRLKVLAVCRISGPNQDVKSLADQEADYRRRLDSWVAHPYDMVCLASQGSGENLEREDYLRAIDYVESREFDLVIVEDMGRLCRRVHAHIFAETCEDCDTRLIAINDHIDTARADWRLNSYFAVMRHETYNRDTAARIRRSLRNRFEQGGVFQCEIFGYIKPNFVKSDADVKKDPAAQPIYEEWFRKLEEGADYAEIADWLNQQGISPGPYSRTDRWASAMVGRITHNPILKGVRVRNVKMSKRINKTGRRVSVNAPPEERLERNCPHLAFIEPARYDRVIAMLKIRNEFYKRKTPNGVDPRKNVPRKRTDFPGQHLRCAICGRLYYWYGVGGKKLMKCSGNLSYRCWNGIELNGTLACEKIANTVFKEIMSLPGFDDAWLQKARDQWQANQNEFKTRKDELARRRKNADQAITRLVDAIAEAGQSASLLAKLRELEFECVQLDSEMAELDAIPHDGPSLPSLDIVKAKAKELFPEIVFDDPEIGRLLRNLMPVLKVFPVRLCDGGSIALRAHVQLNLTALSEQPWRGELPQALQRVIVVDLFEPPQRVRFREQVVQMRTTGKSEKEIAKQLGITKTAVQRAAALQRKMNELNLTDPYVPILEATSEGGLRRHLHPRYRFEPLIDGAADT